MEIEFGTKNLQKSCETETLMKRKFGNELVNKIKLRLVDLRAASNVAELVAGRPHPLNYRRKGQFALHLTNMQRLVFVPVNDPIPRREDGEIEWAKVTKIRIIEIGDYHE